MEGQGLIFVLVFGFASTERCDRATTARVSEGNLGQSGDFNWLGVLTVHLHDEDKIRVAMTGIVLIKIKYALANADDVARIPESVFKSDSQAMFFAAQDTPWFVKPASYVTHPEYEASTLNSIALVELNLEEVNDFPLNPICLPHGDKYNTSRYLYLAGLTDENQVMEKVIYKIQYLDLNVCAEFYDRAGLSSQKRIPSAYLCGYAPSNVTQCIWDNGMALVSNATGYFHLVGFSVYGPGCAAPARFIDLFQYHYWIDSITSPDEVYDDSSFRRNDDDEFIPIHELFAMGSSHRKAFDVYRRENQSYLPSPFDKGVMTHHIVWPDKSVNTTTYKIVRFDNTWQHPKNACDSETKKLMYSEFFTMTTGQSQRGFDGTITYKLSLYDQKNSVASCVVVSINSSKHEDVFLSFKEEVTYKEKRRTPEEILEGHAGATSKYDIQESPFSADVHRFKPEFITDDEMKYEKVLSCDLYIKVEFKKRATIHFSIYAHPGGVPHNNTWPGFTSPPTTTTLKPNTTTTPTTTTPNTTTPTTTTPTTSNPTTTTPTTTTPTTTNPTTTTPTTTNLTITTPTTTTPTTTTPTTTTPTTTTPTTTTPTTTTPTTTKLTTTIPKLRLRKKKLKPIIWETNDRADNTVREDVAKLVTKMQEVEDTASAARSVGTPGVVVMACWLISVFLRTVLYKSLSLSSA